MDLRHPIKEYKNAEQCLLARKFKEAIRHSEWALTQADTDNEQARVLCLLARIYNTQGHYAKDRPLHDKAVDILHNARSLQPTDKDVVFDILLEKGFAHLFRKEVDEAEEIFDYLYEEARNTGDKNKEAATLLAMSELAYKSNEYDKAAQFSYAVLNLSAVPTFDDRMLLKTYRQLVRIYLRRHEYSNILEYGQKTLELAKRYGDLENEFMGLNAIAVYYGNKYDFKQAMFYFRNALDKAQQINYRHGIAHCLINIATIYANLFNYDQALERYMTVLDEYEDVLDDNTGLIIMNNVGNIYFTIEKYGEALDYFQRALDIAESIQYNEMLAHIMAQVSRTLVVQQRYPEAMEYALRSEALLRESSHMEGQQINYITLANIYYKLGNHDLALNYVEKGIACAKEFKDSMSELRGYRLMSNIFKERGDFEKALEYQLIYSQAQEQYTMDQRNRQIMDIEIQYDIQQKEQKIELLTKYQDTLISQRNKIADQNAKLIQSHTDLKQFAYVVSHDLKEPLRMIGSYSQLIQRRYQDKLDDTANEFFDYVKGGVERMNKLLDDLLKYATIGRSDDVEWEVVDLNKVLEITCFNLTIARKESNSEILSEQLPRITSSKPLVLQLFQNLISNAIKFRKPDEPQVIAIRHEIVDNEHRISFSDNGIGIPKEAQEQIFVIFQRLHKNESYKGTGIGLAICMKIIQKLKGSISVESEVGEGTTFTIGLPIDPQNTPSPDKEKPLDLLDYTP